MREPSHIIRLASAATPNAVMTIPEIRLTQPSARESIFDCRSETPPLNSNHHDAEPRKTPATRIAAVA